MFETDRSLQAVHSGTVMRKGERTREQVIEQAAALFNQRGYHGASISDIMQATGLKKGGIYRHFSSKEELAVAAFRLATERMAERFREALAGKTSALEQVRAIMSVFERIPHDPPVPGGCPMLNVTVDADDGNPELLAEARQVMNGLKRLLRAILREGQRQAELRASLDADATSHVIIAQLEGAVMLCRLYGSRAPMRDAIAHLEDWLKQLQ
ncbi:MAG TPA: TetR/AcrR family transcriptional regulator [Polyangiaceae bacterium]|nr:TetR/AcrR family transcriptional regulator [Polyangiaceae bacterium]